MATIETIIRLHIRTLSYISLICSHDVGDNYNICIGAEYSLPIETVGGIKICELKRVFLFELL